MNPAAQNIFDQLPEDAGTEHFLPLLCAKGLKIERIVSHGQASPPDYWYDQDENEWVLLLKGSATLQFVTGETRSLEAGDYLHIPAHVKHRVAATSRDAMWLAVHFQEAR